MLENLLQETAKLGKPEWRKMLAYTAQLHARSVRPAQPPFPYPWEEIGPGYCYGPAFGHWDLIHAILDVLPSEPDHARLQLLNNLAAQEPDGLIPGSIWMREEKPRWSKTHSHPPVWVVAAQEYFALTGDRPFLATVYEAAVRQIGWFESARKAADAGFYYTDILNHSWESGIDEGVRFDKIATGPYACVDATAHVYTLYEQTAAWAKELGKDGSAWAEKAAALKTFMQTRLFDPETGFFHDIWAVSNPKQRPMAFEGIFPMVVGAATSAQAQRVIDENLLNPDRFFTAHPISTVGLRDTAFELRMWRGPAWNSMTNWAARGCLRYGRADAARQLVERALDDCAVQFARTGTIWEFYHSLGGHPEVVRRKPQTPYNAPCRDYLGHNPLIAMARLWEKTK
jgi:glycogen debranching enzyme